MEERNNKLITYLVVIIIAIFASLAILFATGIIRLSLTESKEEKIIEKKDTSEPKMKEKEKSSYIGEYTYTKENDTGFTYTVILDLSSNGTFYTLTTATMKKYYYGTYEIKDNILTLNYQFGNQNAIAMAEELNKSVEYRISSDGTISGIVDEEPLLVSSKETLTKTSDDCHIAKMFTDDIAYMYLSIQDEYWELQKEEQIN